MWAGTSLSSALLTAAWWWGWMSNSGWELYGLELWKCPSSLWRVWGCGSGCCCCVPFFFPEAFRMLHATCFWDFCYCCSVCLVTFWCLYFSSGKLSTPGTISFHLCISFFFNFLGAHHLTSLGLNLSSVKSEKLHLLVRSLWSVSELSWALNSRCLEMAAAVSGII